MKKGSQKPKKRIALSMSAGSNPATPTLTIRGRAGRTNKSAPRSAPRNNYFMSIGGEIFTTPEIKSAGTRWYVEYQLNYERKREYGGINRLKDLQMRMRAAEKLKNKILERLIQKSNPTAIPKASKLRQAMNEVLTIKKLQSKRTHWRSLQTAIRKFSDYVYEENPGIKVADITPTHVREFLNECLHRKNSPRTRNNYLDSLQNIFNVMKDNKVIRENPCTGIVKIPSRSETHVAYTEAEAKNISRWLRQNDPYTLFYSQFVVYPMLRINETRLLQVRDIDYNVGKIFLSAEDSKTTRMVKKIPKHFLKIIRKKKIDKAPAKFYIFSVNGKPGSRPVNPHYFERRFKKCKDVFGFTRLHTMYGLRHTYVCQMIRNGAKWHEVMKYTGHTTLAAFQKYLRSIGAEEPKDLSEFISVKF